MSSSTPAKRTGNGPARGYSWPPFENGNRAAVKHSFYAKRFQPLEREEIAETAELLRSLLPVYSTAFEPSAIAGREALARQARLRVH
jgi:hypothetical protein